MKPKILIDAISLLSPLTGIGRYTYEISKYLKNQDTFDVHYFYGYHSKQLLEPSKNLNIKNLKSILVKNSLLKKILRKILAVSSKIFSPTYDIYWQPNFIPNTGIKSKKVITTVHDFSFVLYKDFHPKERIAYFEKNFFSTIYKSDIIITGSQYSKQEILQRVDFDKEKIKVIYHGIDHNLFKIYGDLSLSFKLPHKFIFSVGSIEPRKNLIGLLNAYNLLDTKDKKEYSLVLAGFQGWENREIMELIEKNKMYIHYLGYVSDEELAKIYNLASLFVYPSFYEGFGLPPLEAMACGTPVITSNVSSLPEVGGDAVIYCDPYEINHIKEKIALVLHDKNLQKEMIAKGLNRAKEFTWEKSGEKHIEVFKKVMEK